LPKELNHDDDDEEMILLLLLLTTAIFAFLQRSLFSSVFFQVVLWVRCETSAGQRSTRRATGSFLVLFGSNKTVDRGFL
jgi:hypothetical protein